MPATYSAYSDWNGDGLYTGTGENITSRVLDNRTPVQTRYGRDQSRALSPPAPGTAQFELNNESRDYSPENAGSPLAGQVLPGRGVYIKATMSAVDYAIFAGLTDDFSLKPNLEEQSVDVSCIDALGRLRGIEVSTELFSGLRTGEALHKLLDAAAWPAALRDIDNGATVMPYWWADDEDCLEAALKLTASEGPPALITCDGQGRIVFRDRHHRITRARSLTAQSTWYSTGAVEPLVSAPAAYNHGFKEVINTLDFEIPVRRPDAAPSVVWSSQERITLATGETGVFTAKASTPFFNAIQPVQGIDYQLVAGAPQITMTKLSGQSTTVSILAVGGPVILDQLQVRATAVQTITTVVVHDEDGASIARYGRRSAPETLLPTWAGVFDARAIQDLILAQRADRVPTISVTLVSANDTRLLQQLTRDLSDRVRLVLTNIGLDADCFIEQIAHSITQGGADHRTTFSFEKAPAATSLVFVLGSATRGILGTNRLGKNGLDDSSLVLKLGTGVLGTNVLGH